VSGAPEGAPYRFTLPKRRPTASPDRFTRPLHTVGHRFSGAGSLHSMIRARVIATSDVASLPSGAASSPTPCITAST